MRTSFTLSNRRALQDYKKIAMLVVLGFAFFMGANAQSVKFNGTSQYGNGGDASSLHLTNFTLEAWIKIDGAGVTTSSGTGGITNVVPIIAKGRGEVDGTPTKETNFLFGYQPSTGRLVADFEDNATASNHPVSSASTLPTCTWIHVAASFSVTANTWKLYINGALNQTLNLGTTIFTFPESRSNVSIAIGTALNSTSAAAGFFNGSIDEVRIWNTVRTDAQVLANYNLELSTGTGLVARWGLNDNTGTTASNSIAGGNAISLSGAPAWNGGYNQAATEKSYLQFDGTNDYLNFGQYFASSAGGVLTGGTIEFWFKARTLDASNQYLISLTKVGSYDGEMRCYIDAPTNNIAFSMDCTGPTSTHRVVSGTTAITAGVWYHVALVWQSDLASSMKIFVNGVQAGASATPACGILITDQNLNVGRNNSSPTDSYFDGTFDELRIWNVVRTATQIQSNMNTEITSGTGLRGRWGFNSSCGTTAANSISGGINGNLANGVLWVAGGPIPSTPANVAPNQPSNPSPANNATASSNNPSLCANVSDPNGGTIRTRFYGRKKTTGGTGQKFTVIVLPDTQYYTAEPQGTNGGNSAMFKAQTNWIANNRAAMNIVYVGQLGDCAQNGDNPPGADDSIEYRRADTAMKTIENAALTGLTQGIPYGISVGNHDQTPNGSASGTSKYYNKYFGEARFTGRSYYGGHYGTDNDNYFDLFSASGIDFIVISMEYNTSPSTAVLDWAAGLLQTYSIRKGIVITHYGIDESTAFGTQGSAIYNRLRSFPNFILFFCGHIHQSDGEARRSDVFNNNTVHTVLSDYQGRSGGGSGLLRIYEFDPVLNKVSVKTYSPYLGSYETDADSQFELNVSLTTATPAPYTLIGELPAAASGSNACVPWSNLLANTAYEWYVELFDGANTTTGPVWTFTTPVVTLQKIDPANVSAVRRNKKPTISLINHADLYPNPAQGKQFSIRFSNEPVDKVSIRVYDVNGRLHLYKQMAGKTEIRIDHQLSPGIYFVKVQSAGLVENKKLVIQK